MTFKCRVTIEFDLTMDNLDIHNHEDNHIIAGKQQALEWAVREFLDSINADVKRRKLSMEPIE